MASDFENLHDVGDLNDREQAVPDVRVLFRHHLSRSPVLASHLIGLGGSLDRRIISNMCNKSNNLNDGLSNLTFVASTGQ